ncbi:hypothetical protein BC670_0522 [Flavobacterium branchiophilum]|uniref:Uncharacterized protein n=1 Tax=Flavobacterium branchiophilum TaxID=55197 RepID=A0A543G0T2_9FLAO|nr:hypothetical protein BC670_0522 [Flavobacterium branchiophilum]
MRLFDVFSFQTNKIASVDYIFIFIFVFASRIDMILVHSTFITSIIFFIQKHIQSF